MRSAINHGGNLDTGRIVAELKREVERLTKAITALEGQSPKAVAKIKAALYQSIGKKRKSGLTAAGRKKLSDSMKKRWAERKKKAAKKG
jgi:hypothetical protein